MAGIPQIRPLLTDARRDHLDASFDHVMHALATAGTDHVGIGSDRDHRVVPDTEDALATLLREEGAQLDWPLYLGGLNGPWRMQVIRDGLRKRRAAQGDIDKVMGNNVLRLYRDVVG